MSNSYPEKGQTTQLKETFSLPLKSMKMAPETFHLLIFFPGN